MSSDERDGWVNVKARGLTYHLLRSEMAAALATQGLHVVSAADKAVLDAAALMMFSNDGCDCIEIDDDGGLPEAELDRREANRAE